MIPHQKAGHRSTNNLTPTNHNCPFSLDLDSCKKATVF